MFLKGTFLGASLFTYTPVPQAYSNLKVYGDVEYGFVKVWNYTPTDAELDALLVTIPQEWDANTLMLASFDDSNTDAGNISGVTTLDNWLIYRRADDESVFTLISTEEADTGIYSDYTVQNGKSYKYQIYPVGSDKIGQPLETAFVEAEMDFYYLIDEATSTSYRMYIEFNPSATTTNRNISYMNTQSKYPTRTRNGNMDYESGSISLMIGDISNTGFEQDIDTVQEFKEFLNNDDTKILKSRKGEVWRVKTELNNTNHFANTNIQQQPYVISFNWTEVGDV